MGMELPRGAKRKRSTSDKPDGVISDIDEGLSVASRQKD